MNCQKVFEESTSFLPHNSWSMLGSDPYIKNHWTLVNGLIWRVKSDLSVRQKSLWKDSIYLRTLQNAEVDMLSLTQMHPEANGKLEHQAKVDLKAPNLCFYTSISFCDGYFGES